MKILIADDHQLFLSGLRALFEAEKEMEVCGEATTGQEAISQTELLKPDVVIMDINMPGMTGIEATREIIAIAPDTKILTLSIHSSKEFVQAMLDAGAAGYIPKDDAPEELIKAIKIVNKGEMYLSPAVTRAALSKDDAERELKGLNILKTKLQRPPVLDNYIIRSRITDELEQNIMKPFSLTSAGPGYGKSVAISQWLENTHSLSTWISMDDEHNDLQIFLAYLTEAFQKKIPGCLQETGKAISGQKFSQFKELLYILFNDLCDIQQDIILVLEDYHKIHDERIHQLLNDWLRFPPPNVHLSIITRRDPPINEINALRLKGRMTEIRMDTLSFTNEEIVRLFKELVNIDLSEADIEMLQDKTEGWIIALRLATMIIKRGENIDETMKAIESGLDPISNFLISEVLSKKQKHNKNILLKTSILNRFCAELLDDIVLDEVEKGEQNICGEEFILWLRKENMFVIDLDIEGKWFRYHHLFQSLLQEQLQKQHSAKEIDVLHLNASSWFENHDFLKEAMHHVLTNGEYGKAVDIVKAQRMYLLNTGQWQLLKHLFQMIPKMIIEKDLELLMVDAYLSFQIHDLQRVEEIVNLTELQLGELDRDSLIYNEYQLFLGFITFIVKDDSETSLKYIKLALDGIPESAATPRSMAELLFPIVSQVSGQYNNLMKWFLKSLNRFEDFADIRKNRLFLGMLAAITAEADLNQLENYYMQGLRLARESKIDESLGECLIMTGAGLMRRGNWQRAISYLEESLDLKFNVEVRTVIDCLTSLVVIYSMLGNHLRCQELIKELESFTQELGDYHKKLLLSCKMRYHVILNDKHTVRDLLKQYCPDLTELVFRIDVPEITYCRALIFEGSDENLKLADESLKGLLKFASFRYNYIHLIEIYALQAILFDQMGKSEQAQETFAKSVELAERGNVIAYYIEIGKPFEQLVGKMPDEIKDRPLIKQIQKVMKTIPSYQLERKITKVTKSNEKKENLSILTIRELEVLECIALGLRNMEIADKLFISDETVKKHLYNMFQKLNVKNRLSLVAKAKKESLMES